MVSLTCRRGIRRADSSVRSTTGRVVRRPNLENTNDGNLRSRCFFIFPAYSRF
jgi:hypothetical protein